MSNVIRINGDLSTKRGQLGLVVYDTFAANIDLNINYNKFYNKYVIDATNNIDCTMPTIGTANNEVVPGDEIMIINSSTNNSNITLLDVPILLSNFTLRPNNYILLLAKNTNVWEILFNTTDAIAINSNTVAPVTLTTDSIGDLYINTLTRDIYIFTGVSWLLLNKASIGPDILDNNTFALITKNIISNDPPGFSFNSIDLTTNVNSEGTMTNVNPVTYTPYPRYNHPSIFSYSATKGSYTQYATGKISPIAAFPVLPAILGSNGTTLYKIEINTGTLTSTLTNKGTFAFGVEGSSLDDSLFLGTVISTGNVVMRGIDVILGTTFDIINLTAISASVVVGGGLGSNMITHKVYKAQPNLIMEISLQPYVRYGPSAPSLPASGYAKVPPAGFGLGIVGIEDIAVDQTDNMIYITADDGATFYLIKYDFYTNTVLQNIVTSPLIFCHLAFSQYGDLFMTAFSPATVRLVNKNTLALGTAITTSVAINSDCAEILYNY